MALHHVCSCHLLHLTIILILIHYHIIIFTVLEV